MDEPLYDAVQLPIVAFAIVAALSLPGRVRLRIPDAGLRVGLILMDCFPQFESVGRRLQWSFRVRSTAADAISFLESTGMVQVHDRDGARALELLTNGRTFVHRTRGEKSDAATLLEALRTSAMRTRHEELRLL
ncbi:MAG: hypothetical protein H6719_12350 [Sandaracinaceae bacterium]|nr:hypothetical protein [Sandaracinaceae bacterium]